MSYIEQPRDWTEQERLEWVKTYQGMLNTPTNNWTTGYAIDYKKKCCDNCEYKLIYDNGNINMCRQQVSNSFDLDINDSDTFYCSYHKFKD